MKIVDIVKNTVIPFVLQFFSNTKKFIVFSAMSSAFTYGLYRYIKSQRMRKGLKTSNKLNKKCLNQIAMDDIDNLKLQMKHPGILPFSRAAAYLGERRRNIFEMNFNFRKYLNNKNLTKQDQVFFNIFQKMAVNAIRVKFA
jgi:hypothetical protein